MSALLPYFVNFTDSRDGIEIECQKLVWAAVPITAGHVAILNSQEFEPSCWATDSEFTDTDGTIFTVDKVTEVSHSTAGILINLGLGVGAPSASANKYFQVKISVNHCGRKFSIADVAQAMSAEDAYKNVVDNIREDDGVWNGQSFVENNGECVFTVIDVTPLY